MRLLCLAAAVVSLCCSDLGGHPRTGIVGQMTTGPGVVFCERGHVQMGTFEKAGMVDADGHFEVDLAGAGPWGVHIYLDGFFYLPLEVEVRDGFLTPVEQLHIRWDIVRMGDVWTGSGAQPDDPRRLAPIPDPEPSDNPTIANPRVAVASGVISVSMDVADPNRKLSRQVLAYDTATGEGKQLNPPSSPVDDNFPDGTYTGTFYLPAGADPDAEWIVVAANHGCSNSPVIHVRPQ